MLWWNMNQIAVENYYTQRILIDRSLDQRLDHGRILIAWSFIIIISWDIISIFGRSKINNYIMNQFFVDYNYICIKENYRSNSK